MSATSGNQTESTKLPSDGNNLNWVILEMHNEVDTLYRKSSPPVASFKLTIRSAGNSQLSKSLGFLRWMVDSNLESVGVRGAAKSLGLTPSSAHRIMSALVEEGFLKRDGHRGRYVLGLELMLLAQRTAARWSVHNVALAPMRAMVAACNEAAFLNIFDRERGENIAVASVESSQALRYVVELHQWKPIYVGAAGWAVMAFLTLDEQRRIIERTKLAPVTDQSITDDLELEHALELAQQRGYAVTHSQRISGAVGIAAPLFGTSGEVLGSVGLSMPEQRFSTDKELQLVSLVQRCASEIMGLLGGRKPQTERSSSTIAIAMER